MLLFRRFFTATSHAYVLYIQHISNHHLNSRPLFPYPLFNLVSHLYPPPHFTPLTFFEGQQHSIHPSAAAALCLSFQRPGNEGEKISFAGVLKILSRPPNPIPPHVRAGCRIRSDIGLLQNSPELLYLPRSHSEFNEPDWKQNLIILSVKALDAPFRPSPGPFWLWSCPPRWSS